MSRNFPCIKNGIPIWKNRKVGYCAIGATHLARLGEGRAKCVAPLRANAAMKIKSGLQIKISIEGKVLCLDGDVGRRQDPVY